MTLTLSQDACTSFDHLIHMCLHKIIGSVRRDRTQFLPIRQFHLIQTACYIEAEIGVIREGLRKTTMNILRLACHSFKSSENGWPAISDCDNVAKASPDTQDAVVVVDRRYDPGLVSQHLARIIVTKTCVNELDALTATRDQFEEGSRSRCCAGNILDCAGFEVVSDIVCLKFGRKRIYVCLPW